jgi:hypothetical protein
MLTNEQIQVVAAEVMVPSAIVNGTAKALERLDGRFTLSDLIAAVLALEEASTPAPADDPARFWARRRTEPDA